MAKIKPKEKFWNFEYDKASEFFLFQSAPDKATMIHYANDEESVDLLVASCAGDDLEISPSAIFKLRKLGYKVEE